MNTARFEPTLATSISIVRHERETRGHSLEQIEGGGAPQKIELNRKQFIIGRAEDADIKLESRKASRQHAILNLHGTDFTIRDHESHNGIFLNGVKIHSAVLRDGDVIQIADCAFIFREG